MKTNYIVVFFLKLIFVFFLNTNLLAERDFFTEGKELFEKDIVFNPKNEQSYFYLSKIFKKKDNINLEEKNLKTVILLNPKNEEAILNLTFLNIKNSDFSKSKELIFTFEKICVNLCSSADLIKKNLADALNNK
jgi:tetratricopeptide (TPR) repeat protein